MCNRYFASALAFFHTFTHTCTTHMHKRVHIRAHMYNVHEHTCMDNSWIHTCNTDLHQQVLISSIYTLPSSPHITSLPSLLSPPFSFLSYSPPLFPLPPFVPFWIYMYMKAFCLSLIILILCKLTEVLTMNNDKWVRGPTCTCTTDTLTTCTSTGWSKSYATWKNMQLHV